MMTTVRREYPRCQRCGKLKPPRCHHCSTCGKCILKMDHHCIWVGNCIGLHNYKYFLLLLFYGAVTCLFVTITLWPHINALELVNVTLMFWFCAAISFSLSVLLVFHLFLVSRNMTTLEFLGRVSGYMRREECQAWDKGCIANWIEVFGDPSPIYWLLPLAPQRYRSRNNQYKNTMKRQREIIM
jgi:hypothetical protein